MPQRDDKLNSASTARAGFRLRRAAMSATIRAAIAADQLPYIKLDDDNPPCCDRLSRRPGSFWSSSAAREPHPGVTTSSFRHPAGGEFRAHRPGWR
jgi:hypothetical protein